MEEEAEVIQMPLSWRMKLRKVKEHLKRQKMAYIMGAVSVGIFALMQRQRIDFEKFLRDQGIDPDKYYFSEEDQEWFKGMGEKFSDG